MEENEVNDGLQLADEVVSAIAGIATKGIEGMAKMAGGFTEGITEAFGKKNLGKGVKVEANGDKVQIEASIVVKFGAKIPEVAAKIQEKIKADVEEMTGLKVSGVKVKVVGIEGYEKIEAEEETK